jgi:hypothetical protein
LRRRRPGPDRGAGASRVECRIDLSLARGVKIEAEATGGSSAFSLDQVLVALTLVGGTVCSVGVNGHVNGQRWANGGARFTL